MQKTLTVRAAPGISLPMEGKPRRHITEHVAQAVPDSPYYRRALKCGDLIEVRTERPIRAGEVRA